MGQRERGTWRGPSSIRVSGGGGDGASSGHADRAARLVTASCSVAAGNYQGQILSSDENTIRKITHNQDSYGAFRLLFMLQSTSRYPWGEVGRTGERVSELAIGCGNKDKGLAR